MDCTETIIGGKGSVMHRVACWGLSHASFDIHTSIGDCHGEMGRWVRDSIAKSCVGVASIPRASYIKLSIVGMMDIS